MKMSLRLLICLVLPLASMPGGALAGTGGVSSNRAALDAARGAFDAEFADPTAKALALHLTTKFRGGTAGFFAALASTSTADRSVILAKLKADVHGAMSELLVNKGRTQSAHFTGSADALAVAGKDKKDILAYYCPILKATSREEAARPHNLRQGLKRFNLASLSAVGAQGLEESRELANPLAANYDAAAAHCAEFNRSATSRHSGSAAFNPPASGNSEAAYNAVVPEPGVGEDKAAAPKEAGKPLPWKKMAIGAVGGAIGFGVIGFLLGGPAGLLVGAAVGALFMAGVTWALNS